MKSTFIGALMLTLVTSITSASPEADKQLIKAAFRGDVRNAKRLLVEGVNPNAIFGVYEKEAFKGRDNALSPIGSETWTPLLAVAASVGIPDCQIAIARLLLRSGARIEMMDSRGASPLATAIASNNIELALFLLDEGANPNVKIGVYIDNVEDQTPLHLAVGHPILLRRLIQAGANVSATSKDGSTALMNAWDLGFPESEQILAEAEKSGKK